MDQAQDFWIPRQKSWWAKVSVVLLFLLTFAVCGWADFYAIFRLGLTPRGLRVTDAVFFPLGLYLATAVHESGHALIALAVGFRFRALKIGSLTTWRSPGQPRQYEFNWGLLFDTGGYVGAVPDSDVHVRSRMILIVLAGPCASLLAAACLWMGGLGLRDTVFAASWHRAAILGSVSVASCLVNLIPIGYSDGSMLWHLAFWTKRGRHLISKLIAATLSDDADQQQRRFNFGAEAELRRRAIEHVLSSGMGSSPDLARAYQQLGWAQRNAYDLVASEASTRTSLEVIEPFRNAQPAREAVILSLLCLILRESFQAQEADDVYGRAVLALEHWKSAERSVSNWATVCAELAERHIFHGNFELAKREIDQALARLPAAFSYPIPKANLFMYRASCEFELGHSEAGQAAVEMARQILHSSEIGEAERTQAIQRLAGLGELLSMAGREAQGAELLLESAKRFEEAGINSYAARLRIIAAADLHACGRLADSEAALPAEAAVAEWDLSNFLAERAAIFLSNGRVPDAVSEYEKALKAAIAANQIALRQESLAAAYFEADRVEEASDLARTACQSLKADPNAAGALVTLALDAWLKGDTSARSYFDQALSHIDATRFFPRARKARLLDQIAMRLERSHRTAEAREARQAAQQHRRVLCLDQLTTEHSPVAVIS